jgi:hypothetical protein
MIEMTQSTNYFPIEASIPPGTVSLEAILHRGAASSPVASTRLREGEPRARSAGRRACRVTVQYPSDTGGDNSRRHPV